MNHRHNRPLALTSPTVIDLHCHLLPALDDGPPDMEASLEMARRALDGGSHTVVATPHVDLEYLIGPEEIAPGVEALRAALSDRGLPLTVLAGAELGLSRCAALDDDQLSEVCLGHGSYALVESPYTSAGALIEEVLFELQVRGFRPLLAHPERCPEFQRDIARLERLVERGVACSLSVGSLSGQFGRTVRRFASRLLEQELIHNVSSDAHDAENRAPFSDTTLSAELGRLGVASLQEWFTTTVPVAILADEPLPPRPPSASRPRPRWRRLMAGE